MPLMLIARGTCTSPYRIGYDHHSHALGLLRFDCGRRVLDVEDSSKPSISRFSDLLDLSGHLRCSDTRGHVVPGH
jgi:hypothetical protein